MKRKKKNQEEQPSAPGSAPGQAVTPDDALLPVDNVKEGGPQAIPIGAPVPPEEWRKLKSQAETPQTPPGQAADETCGPPEVNADEDEDEPEA